MLEISELEKLNLCNDIDCICATLEQIVRQYRAAADYVKAGNQSFADRMCAAAYRKFQKLAAELNGENGHADPSRRV